MAALIIVMLCCGLMIVGQNKGWFLGADARTNAIARETLGVSSLERGGIAYSISKNTIFRDGDILETKTGSSITIKFGTSTLVLSEKTKLAILCADPAAFTRAASGGRSVRYIK
jgi:hypothetical protein